MKKLLLIALMAVVGLGAVGCVSTTVTELPVVEQTLTAYDLGGDWTVTPAGTYDELLVGVDGTYIEYLDEDMGKFGNFTIANNIVTMTDSDNAVKTYRVVGFEEETKITVQIDGRTEVWTPFGL